MAECVPDRVILHLDMDAFYAAVEAKRLGLDGMKVPLGVVQYDTLIAVSYAARPHGVKRGMHQEEARNLCPEISLPHVEYLSLSRPSTAAAAASDSEEVQRSNAKVSLRRYREASRAVLAVLRRFSKHIEKASIDEVYVDVTEAAVEALRGGVAALTDEERRALERTMTSGGALLFDPDSGGKGESTDGCGGSMPAESATKRERDGLVEEEDEEEEEEQNHRGDQLLRGGAMLAARMRLAVSRETGYTMSAGVAHNKMLAKLGSSRFKPNRCTVVLNSDVAMLMTGLRLNSINGLRGKRGERVLAALGGDDETTVGTVVAMGEAELKRRLGGAGAGVGVGASDSDDATWLLRVMHGEDAAGISPNLLPKSINSFKSFPVVHTAADLRCWLELLAQELHERIEEDTALNQRRPSSMTLGHRAAWSDHTPMRTRTQRLSTGGANGLSAARVLACAEELLRKHDRAVPCTRLQLSVSNFVSVASCGGGGITNFFGSGKATTRERPAAGALPNEEAARATGAREVKKLTPAPAASIVPASATSVAPIAPQSAATCVEQNGSWASTGGSELRGGESPPPPRCAECGQRVAAEFMQMHRDQHMAERLQREWRRQDGGQADNTGSGTARGRGQVNNKRGPPQARIVNFFQVQPRKKLRE